MYINFLNKCWPNIVFGFYPYPNYFTQSRLQCTQQLFYRNAGSAQRVRKYLSHPIGSPRNLGRVPYAVMARPKILTPSTSPDLGNQGQHHELHRYARQRF